MKRVFLLLLFGFLMCVGKTFGQNTSNEGTDFWTVFPTHVPSGASSANIVVFVTSKFDSEVTVSCGASYSETKAIPANTAIEFHVSRAASYVDFSEKNTILINRGIHIQVTAGQPKVSAYAHIYAGFRSAASLILPFETLGQNYYSMNYTQVGSGDNFLTLVAVESKTDLLLHKKNGSIVLIKLENVGDVYEYIEGGSDLTGVFATTDPATSSCKKFAAFSGSSALSLGSCSVDPMSSQDPLYQQLYPTASWGKNYGVVPFKDRRYILRIVAQDDNTSVKFNGRTQIINKGEFIESDQLTQSTLVTADKLISVAQYALTQNCSSTTGGRIEGDPDMVILNPIEFNIKGITVFSSDKERINTRYLNILIKYNQSSSFKINGVKPNVIWQALNGDATYAFAQIEVYQTSLTLSADDGFNAIAYGFGNAESYAYSAGTNLASNNYLSVVNTSTKQTNPDGCVGVESQLNIALPYKAQSVGWLLDGADPKYETTPKLIETKNNNGDITYIYQSPYKKTFPTASKHLLRADVVVADAGPCFTGNITTNYTFNIYNLPTAGFDSNISGCENSNIQFSDSSSSNNLGFGITEWKWDFGDGSDPDALENSEQTPQHKYLKEGIFDVKLVVKSGTGCFSDVVQHPVTIYPVPVANFQAFDKSCTNAAVLFTDNSVVGKAVFSDSSIKNWHWDFGDGTTAEDRPDGNPFTHKFTKTGDYAVTLSVTSNNNCGSIQFSKTISIFNGPVVDFLLPDYCINDGAAIFTNASKNIDGTEDGLTYTWKFDAANPAATSTQKDGQYAFPAPGNYQVRLSIANGIGCEISTSKTFTVNSVVDNADFTIQNKGNVCSGTDVIINNTSTIAVGKIIKIDVFKDYIGNPADKITVPRLTADDIILSYASFGGNVSKTYNIRLVAYSGQNCFKEVTKQVTINPSPQLVFNAIPKICTDQGFVLIDEAKETSGLQGLGVFSGVGIDADGNFNPKVAGVGQHRLTYTFSGKNGCSKTIEQTVSVYASPTIALVETVYVLSGGQLLIPASATGDNLTYKWFPSTFLDHDDVLMPLVSPTANINYTLVISSADGCSATATVKVKILESLEVSNAFSPNGDGINDVWIIKYLYSYPDATVEVFNRNGSRVFFSKGYEKPFDGTYKNLPLPIGVYYYIINPKNGQKLVTGPLTIIR
ncbi:gliding motility-associated-like protein [Pedobacter sp. UYP30]|uniref:PKD domain-containing protein n=1 Tax=Pedobacter sp. UYP30 TaxID=1756400 RepID=UPI0033918C96